MCEVAQEYFRVAPYDRAVAHPEDGWTSGDRESARRAWKALPRTERVEVRERALAGQRHPDPAVAAVADAWARGFFAAGWWNRVPGWLLPVVGVAIAVADWFVFPWLALGGVVVTILGLLGWSTRRLAASIVALPDDQPG